jgi:hypothetical protein
MPANRIGTKAMADKWCREALSQRVKITPPTMKNKAITTSAVFPPVVGNLQISVLNMKYPPPIISYNRTTDARLGSHVDLVVSRRAFLRYPWGYVQKSDMS